SNGGILSAPLSSQLADWSASIRFEDLPADVIESTKLRVLDIMGLCLAGAETQFGKCTRDAAVVMSPPGPCSILGFQDRVSVTGAALANGALAQALEYDDTHVESIVHMSGTAVVAALALSETMQVSGRDLILAIAVGNEVSCRVGSVSSGELHKRGFHPTGLFTTFGAAYLAAKLLRLEAAITACAAGIAGSFAGGLLECWVDGTQTKFLHSGWSAQSGITAALLARAGVTGPAEVFEGRWGVFASHVQAADAHRDFSRISAGLGTLWESRKASFKPYPAAHVIHPYITAALRLLERHRLNVEDIASVECPVAAFIVNIVCEPVAEKVAPATGAHGRVSLQYTLAEALFHGKLGKDAYADKSLANPTIQALTRKVGYYVDPSYPGPGQFKGAVKITMNDGSSFEEIEEFNRGSAENPMTQAELTAKFHQNAAGLLSPSARASLAAGILALDTLPNARELLRLAQIS
ncbi:MAG: MmgE/PrpD family protein, partial [Acidobacteriota bacterium]